MKNTPELARSDWKNYEDQQPKNFFAGDPDLRRILSHWVGEKKLKEWEPELSRFGAECAGPVDAAVRSSSNRFHLPRLERYSPIGERIEEIEFHPDYHVAGKYIYGSGLLPLMAQPGCFLQSQGLFFLSALNGEAGHNCPVGATAGMIRAFHYVASHELKERYFPRLLSSDYETLAHGTQFLTEAQGGSDVGQNRVRAVREGDHWRIHGEKWFCSAASFDLVLMTARPDGAEEGTKGLGLFLVPRRLPDGSMNAFSYRRLKEKIGTQSMASAEIDFNGAFAWAMGPIEDGFHNMMTHVINISRLINGVSTSAYARRACHTAIAYAKNRSAFGSKIMSYPMVQETLANIHSETSAMTSGSLHLIHLLDRCDLKQASPEEAEYLRVAMNLNKVRSAQSSHEVIVSAIETLGGNGAIETFSVLPRLLRDNIVFENWEGTHNVLLLQVLRDCKRKGLQKGYFAHLRTMTKPQARVSKWVTELEGAFEEMLGSDEGMATLKMRALAGPMAWAQWAAAMIQDGAPVAVLDHFLDRRAGPAHAKDETYLKRLAGLMASLRT